MFKKIIFLSLVFITDTQAMDDYHKISMPKELSEWVQEAKIITVRVPTGIFIPTDTPNIVWRITEFTDVPIDDDTTAGTIICYCLSRMLASRFKYGPLKKGEMVSGTIVACRKDWRRIVSPHSKSLEPNYNIKQAMDKYHTATFAFIENETK